MKKILLAVAIAVVPFITFADTDSSSNTTANSEQQQNFNAHKAKISKKIQQKITRLQQKLDTIQQEKSCIDKATTKDALKACKSEKYDKESN
ncbi:MULTISPECIES: hypothetical protein [unclassified Francisella]|uniref:hypothetical protein n=1 Tax=unclassified Francisella TaxID=2610885 RepID=UPI002E316AAC|nr:MULTISPECIES: hypothetical protein [unclassified Francisella]MED7820222.1 hypothetical protein [Francisella sp. 19S2-4]MED7831080.1 hypothetical protein [Francisella sp. 19S2-10]